MYLVIPFLATTLPVLAYLAWKVGCGLFINCTVVFLLKYWSKCFWGSIYVYGADLPDLPLWLEGPALLLMALHPPFAAFRVSFVFRTISPPGDGASRRTVGPRHSHEYRRIFLVPGYRSFPGMAPIDFGRAAGFDPLCLVDQVPVQTCTHAYAPGLGRRAAWLWRSNRLRANRLEGLCSSRPRAARLFSTFCPLRWTPTDGSIPLPHLHFR